MLLLNLKLWKCHDTNQFRIRYNRLPSSSIKIIITSKLICVSFYVAGTLFQGNKVVFHAGFNSVGGIDTSVGTSKGPHTLCTDFRNIVRAVSINIII